MQHATPAKVPEGPCVGRHERLPVGGRDVADPDADERQDDDQLDRHHEIVDARRLARAPYQQEGQQRHDRRGRQIGDGRRRRAVGELDDLTSRGRKPGWDGETDGGQGPVEVARPSDGHCGGTDRIFENEVPADQPGRELAQAHISVGVGAAGNRHQRRQLRIAERDERAGKAGQHERQDHGGPGIEGGGRTGQDEDAGADDGADAHEDDADGAQNLGQRGNRAGRCHDIRKQLTRRGAREFHADPPPTS